MIEQTQRQPPRGKYEIVEGNENDTPFESEIDVSNNHDFHSALSNTSSQVHNPGTPIILETADEEQVQRITWFDASMHLIKGNLGPGCLNIPHAFALSGWLLGTGLFLLVAIQGIYSMYLLTFCKRLLPVRCHTFMDVAHYALGKPGQRTVQCLLFVLQTGVCCVFLSLIATNLQAQTDMGHTACVVFTTIALLGVVLLQKLKDLRWLSAIANVFMITAIVTSAVAGIRQFISDDLPPPPRVATSEPGDIATFVTAMFFSFEGIGLVLPVEKGFTAGYVSREEEVRANRWYGTRVLPLAMSVVATLFLLIGTTASWGFPDLTSGSITAYLAQRFPDQAWFGFVNILVMLAVLLTFPLQLTPAMEGKNFTILAMQLLSTLPVLSSFIFCFKSWTNGLPRDVSHCIVRIIRCVLLPVLVQRSRKLSSKTTKRPFPMMVSPLQTIQCLITLLLLVLEPTNGFSVDM